MKILFLTSEGFDTPNSINHLCETLLEDILKSGIEVHSISSHKTGQYADIPEQLLKYEGFTYDPRCAYKHVGIQNKRTHPDASLGLRRHELLQKYGVYRMYSLPI